ncbi:MAG: hypothetical protein WC043_06745 [Pseudobdellovibrionaceae bacterium]
MQDEFRDRAYLRTYVPSLLAMENGAFYLGNMIASADTAAELKNYEPEHVALCCRALMTTNPAHYFDKFAKSVARDKTHLWPALVETFGGHLDEAIAKTPDHGALLRQVAAKYPDLKAVLEARSASQGISSSGQKPPALA